MKKIFKSFVMFFASVLLMIPLTSVIVSAEDSAGSGFLGTFDTSKNKTEIIAYKGENENKDKLMLQINVTYTRGFDKDTAAYMICRKNDSTSEITIPTHCSEFGTLETGKSSADSGGWDKFVTSGDENTFSNQVTGTAADANPTTRSYTVNTGIIISSDNRENSYVVFVRAYFCSRRVIDETTGEYKNGGCLYWHNPDEFDGESPFSRIELKLSDVQDKNITDIEDEELSELMQVIKDVVMGIVMPIIYVVLGLFLVVKGSLLGIQIVKSADEPQIRKEKIGSLKWLVIGVAIAYAASGLVHVVMGVLSGAFNFS